MAIEATHKKAELIGASFQADVQSDRVLKHNAEQNVMRISLKGDH
jgi:hypothetical protein